jgi:acyl dehydratase
VRILALLAENIGDENLRAQKHLCIPGNIMRVIKSFEDAKALEGEEIGLSDWVVIDQNRIDQFADATGDHQWIHVDTERAAQEMPDGQTIAHGYLTLALVPALSANFVEFENLARAINFGANKVRFYTPVPVGSRVRARAAILQARHRGGALLLSSEVKIEVDGERKPACVAEVLGMYFFNEQEGL